MSLRRFRPTSLPPGLAPLGLAALLLSGCGSSAPPSERQGNASPQEVETPAEFFQLRDDESLAAWSARTRAVTVHWRENWARLVQGMPGETEEFVDRLVQASGELVQREPGRWRVTTFSGVECVVLLPDEDPEAPVAADETPIVTFAGMVRSIDGERNQVTLQDCAVMSVVSKTRWDELRTGTERRFETEPSTRPSATLVAGFARIQPVGRLTVK